MESINSSDILASSTKLQTHFRRFEFKYHLPAVIADKILPELRDYMVWDPYIANREDKAYFISSLYYDNEGLGCYYQKFDGLGYRKKIRVRVYDQVMTPETPVYIELKRKADMTIIKDRLRMKLSEYVDLMEGKNYAEHRARYTGRDLDILDEFLWLVEYNSLTPQLMVTYYRKALQSPLIPDFRVTFDSQIRTYQSKHMDVRLGGMLIYPEVVILEVKYNNIVPFWFHRIIQKYKLDRQTYSKYGFSTEAIHHMPRASLLT